MNEITQHNCYISNYLYELQLVVRMSAFSYLLEWELQHSIKICVVETSFRMNSIRAITEIEVSDMELTSAAQYED